MTLKAFIQGFGFFLCALVAGPTLYLDARTIFEIHVSYAIYAIGALLILNVLAYCIGRRFWMMGRNWDGATIADYADLQALLTGFALAQVAAKIWPHSLTAGLGFFFFICTRGFLRRYLQRRFGFVDSRPPDDHGKNGPGDVLGTPWQTNPSHTAG